MAKTVFGVPGIGDTSRETTGDAVAPGGTPGAQSRVELPQKGGKEPASSTDEKHAVAEPTEDAASPKPPEPDLPASPEPAKPASGPAMAKPKAPPMAKPSPAAKPAAPGAKGGGKTVFGMPAMKLPVQPPDAATPGTSPTQPADAPWKDEQDPAKPQAAAEAKEGDAYKATVLGMSAMDLSDGPADSAAEPSFPDIDAASSVSEAPLEKAITRPPEKPAAPAGTGTAMGGSARFPDKISTNSNRGLIIAIIVLFIILVALVLYFFGSSGEPAVSNAPPSSLSEPVSLGSAAQTAAEPEAAQ